MSDAQENTREAVLYYGGGKPAAINILESGISVAKTEEVKESMAEMTKGITETVTANEEWEKSANGREQLVILTRVRKGGMMVPGGGYVLSYFANNVAHFAKQS